MTTRKTDGDVRPIAEPTSLPPTGPVAIYSSPRSVSPASDSQPRPKVRIQHLRKMKRRGRKIVAVTCYDATFARLVEAAAVDVVLVGDSLGNVVQGQESTLPVTVDDIIYHARAVARGLQTAHLVADMPFMSYRTPEVALQNAGRLMAEGAAHAVKIEGAFDDVARLLVAHGIPVMGHLGLTPQSVHAMGGHRVQGKTASARQRIQEQALALQDAGCYAIVLEGVPADLAEQISASLAIPTIGIGAGAGCDGQILVLYDMLGLNPGFEPKFLRHFAQLGKDAIRALNTYAEEVRGGSFPAPEHEYGRRGVEAQLIAVEG